MLQDTVKISELRDEEVVRVTKNILNLVYHLELKPRCQSSCFFGVDLIVGGSLGATIVSVRVRLTFAGNE